MLSARVEPPLFKVFLYFFGYNLLFLVIQLVWTLQHQHHFLATLPLPPVVWRVLGYTFLAHIVLYAMLAIAQSALYCSIHINFVQQQSKQILYASPQTIILLVFILSHSVILLANEYFFPLSRFSHQIGFFHSPTFSLAIGCLAGLILMYWALPGIRYILTSYPKMIGAFVLSLCIICLYPEHRIQNNHASPHILFIGIDSVPPSQVNASATPYIASFLRDSVQFKETISPLARTYPAWVSILTGLYPKHHHAHENLMTSQHVKREHSIVWDFNQAGYQSLFATDDRQFNSMDNDLGFQHILGPKRGVCDVLLASLNDFPLSNLLLQYSFSRWLFPYNYLNRASYFSYRPQTFSHALQQTIQQLDPTHPWFIAVHFALPHWPYAFASSPPLQNQHAYNNQLDVAYRQQLYQQALTAADQQMAHLMTTFAHSGFLKNSIVILLSDHGESFYVPGSRHTEQRAYQGVSVSRLARYFQHDTTTDLDKSAGHGSDLLSPEQYHCILGWQYFKQKPQWPAHEVSQRVALIDIAPTLYELKHWSTHKTWDGLSLSHALYDPKARLPLRHFFLESGMLPNQFLDEQQAQKLGQQYFAINPNDGLLLFRSDRLSQLNHMKLHAILKGPWLLAFYPTRTHHIPVLQQVNDGRWSDDLSSDFARQAPTQALINDFFSFWPASYAQF